MKFVPTGQINNNPALVQIMAWRHQVTSHYLNQWWQVYWRIYASLRRPRWVNEESTLVHVMTWCCQTTNHYLSQYWPRSISPYGVTRPQCRPEVILWNMKLYAHFPSYSNKVYVVAILSRRKTADRLSGIVNSMAVECVDARRQNLWTIASAA